MVKSFCDLPAEIRNIIYELALRRDCYLGSTDSQVDRFRTHPYLIYATLLSVPNRMIHTEASSMFYRQNIFYLEPEIALRFAERMGSDNARRVRHLNLSSGQVRIRKGASPTPIEPNLSPIFACIQQRFVKTKSVTFSMERTSHRGYRDAQLPGLLLASAWTTMLARSIMLVVTFPDPCVDREILHLLESFGWNVKWSPISEEMHFDRYDELWYEHDTLKGTDWSNSSQQFGPVEDE